MDQSWIGIDFVREIFTCGRHALRTSRIADIRIPPSKLWGRTLGKVWQVGLNLYSKERHLGQLFS